MRSSDWLTLTILVWCCWCWPSVGMSSQEEEEEKVCQWVYSSTSPAEWRDRALKAALARHLGLGAMHFEKSCK